MEDGDNSDEGCRHSTSPLFNRAVIRANDIDSDKEFPSTADTLSVVSYNILADCHRVKSDYSYTDEAHLGIGYRHKGILAELRYLNADCACLQEVETAYYNDVLYPAMKSLGYEGKFIQKRCDTPEGEAIFYREDSLTLEQIWKFSYHDLACADIDKLQLSDSERQSLRSYLDQDAVLIIGEYRVKASGRTVVIGATHLTYNKFEYLDIPCLQMSYAFQQMAALSCDRQLPFILCGDFNTRVFDPAYQLARDGSLSNDGLHQLRELKSVPFPDGSVRSLVDILPQAFQHPVKGVVSSYLHVQGKEPERTSYNLLMDAGVDYIWAKELRVLSITEVNGVSEYTPNMTYPSDHLSLKATFTFP